MGRRGNSNNEMIRIKGWLIHQTQKAILVRVEDGDKTVEIWLPLSQIDYTIHTDNVITVSLPLWLAESRNVVHLKLDENTVEHAKMNNRGGWYTDFTAPKPTYVAITGTLVEDLDDSLILATTDRENQVVTIRLHKEDIIDWKIDSALYYDYEPALFDWEPESEPPDDYETTCTIFLLKDRADELELNHLNWAEYEGQCPNCGRALDPPEFLRMISNYDELCSACEDLLDRMIYKAQGGL